MVAKDMLNQAAIKCPNSSIFMSGYSQGAMVVRNGIAYADDAAKKRVKVSFFLSLSLCFHLQQKLTSSEKGVVTFGDPFQGAPIKGYTGPITTYCKVADGVCGGNFELSAAHLSYPFDSSVAEAKADLKKMAANATA
jgi:hypothetical protein